LADRRLGGADRARPDGLVVPGPRGDRRGHGEPPRLGASPGRSVMSLDLAGAWDATVRSPVFGVALTLAAYQVGRWAWHRSGNRPWVNPVLVAVVLIGGLLALLDIEYDEY